MKWLVASLVLVLALAVVGYIRVGWWRMEEACAPVVLLAGDESSGVEYSWTWSPLGFTCIYDDGSTRTSLWY